MVLYLDKKKDFAKRSKNGQNLFDHMQYGLLGLVSDLIIKHSVIS